MYMYKICFITLLITNMFKSLLRSSSVWLYKSTKNTIICHLEYRETLKVIINASHIEYFSATLMVMTKVINTYW